MHLWEKLGAKLPRPTAILVISAHWAAREPTVSTACTPETIHDFGGFPDALYAMQYQAPGAPALAARVRELLTAAKLPNGEVSDRGLDHGAWIPLQAMYPDADIPVVELALQPFAGTDWHRRIGAALRPLRDEGVLILASGAVHATCPASVRVSPSFPRRPPVSADRPCGQVSIVPASALRASPRRLQK